jgi:soluble lytic murein transglycosylase-like protein
MPDYIQLFIMALISVESGGDNSAIGDNGAAYGCLQLHSAYVQDAAEHAGEDWTHDDAFDRETAIKIALAYFDRYATKQRLGRTPTFEDWARIHNGGPNGFKKTATDKYWKKVKTQFLTNLNR